MKKIRHLLTSRWLVTGLLILIQILFFIGLILQISSYFYYVQLFLFIISFFTVLSIINYHSNPTFKLPWILLIILFPLLGGVLYWIFGKKYVNKTYYKKIHKQHLEGEQYWREDYTIRKELKEQNILAERQSRYIYHYADMPLWKNTETTYYPVGEAYFKDLIHDLRQAKHFIFLEFFIIHEGKMWNSILGILKEKAKEGVDIRIIYDDIGCIDLLPKYYYKTIASYGIKCVPFNRFIPIVSVFHNNRDHRKMVIIDGMTAFTGGINLADEYINEKKRFGHWKDTAVRLTGDGVWNFTLLFLDSWNHLCKTDSDYNSFRPNYNHKETFKGTGFVQPYGDSPFDRELIGETVYLNIINQAKQYLYINTPYLIISYEIVVALSNAAKRGVDVRITTPHIPDKWYIHIITQSYYQTLIEAGVHIYEYIPGFIHAKSFLADDEIGVISTINLDYRSLVHHYECGVWMYKTTALKQLKEDHEQLRKESKEINLAFCRAIPWYKRWIKDLLQLFAPLL